MEEENNFVRKYKNPYHESLYRLLVSGRDQVDDHWPIGINQRICSLLDANNYSHVHILYINKYIYVQCTYMVYIYIYLPNID